MNKWENHLQNVEQPNVVANQPTAAHTEVFQNPQEYLATLRNNFTVLSHGHDSISPLDLETSERDEALNPKTREAARITDAHYDELYGIRRRQNEDIEISSGINRKDISFAEDMVNHKITGHAITNAATDLGRSAYLLGVGGSMGAFGSSAIAAGEGSALLASSAVGAGVVFAGIGVYEGYKGITAYNNLSKASEADTTMIKSWLK